MCYIILSCIQLTHILLVKYRYVPYRRSLSRLLIYLTAVLKGSDYIVLNVKMLSVRSIATNAKGKAAFVAWFRVLHRNLPAENSTTITHRPSLTADAANAR